MNRWRLYSHINRKKEMQKCIQICKADLRRNSLSIALRKVIDPVSRAMSTLIITTGIRSSKMSLGDLTVAERGSKGIFRGRARKVAGVPRGYLNLSYSWNWAWMETISTRINIVKESKESRREIKYCPRSTRAVIWWGKCRSKPMSQWVINSFQSIIK